ncbi:uncharacterized protein KGF55_003735 [Candida pseudojiufengensis]|uniref:uncharacterized protein n=1 Tax=Candida pseudojiufengensis TaxID=497109 RepID=UPI0022253766|nr:uncharacterized protein KGF55_003735 [Candida pseudojiufengensis]KAI5962659.1 hypothetical protein KGF55_003735 [Candida pseudojiufengensis]
MTTAIPRSSHASIITGSTSDPFRQSYQAHKHSDSFGSNLSSTQNKVYSRPLSTSNPFEIIYTDEDFTTTHTKQQQRQQKPSNPSVIQSGSDAIIPQELSIQLPQNQWHNSENYNLISHNISTGGGSFNLLKDPSKSSVESKVNQNHHPIVTLIDPDSIKRSGSQLSRSATMRNRNKIKSRNKTVNRKEIHKGFVLDERNFNISNNEKLGGLSSNNSSPPRSPKSSNSIWPKFIFPVLRKKSLKYQSVSKSIPNFKNEDQFRNFINSTNYNEKVLSMLPHRIKMWNFTEPLHPHPLLNYKVIKTNKIEPKLHNHHRHSRSNSINLMDSLYSCYRSKVFQLNQQLKSHPSGKLQKYQIIPPKFQKLYPQDSILLSKKELNRLNLNLAVEILLRRTVAAKMEYRLKHNGLDFNKVDQSSSSIFSSSSASSSLNSSSSSSSSSTYETHDIESSASSTSSSNPSNHPQKSKSPKDSLSSNNSSDFYNNDDILLQNQSMFNDLLITNSNPSYTESGNHHKPPKSHSNNLEDNQAPSAPTRLRNPFSLDPRANSYDQSIGLSHPKSNQSSTSQLDLSKDDKYNNSRNNLNSSLSLSSITYSNNRKSNSFSNSLSSSILTSTHKQPKRKSINTSNTSCHSILYDNDNDTQSNEAQLFNNELSPKNENFHCLVNDFKIDINELRDETRNYNSTSHLKRSYKVHTFEKLGSKKTIPGNIIDPDSIIKNMNGYDDLYK